MKNIYAILVLSLLASCGPIMNDSGLDSQLTQKIYQCHDFTKEQEDAALSDMPSNFLSSRFNEVDRERLRNGLTSVPREHLDFFYDAHQATDFSVSPADMEQGVLGLTGFNQQWPLYLRIAKKEGAANFAFVHELGHAYDVKLRLDYRSGDLYFAREIDQVYQSEGKTKGPSESGGLAPLRKYAMSSVKEYLAESYQNFYCGPEAHEYFKAKLPSTYELLSKVLKAPTWMNGSTPNNPGVSGNLHIALQNINGQYFLDIALPTNSYTLRMCSTKDSASCSNDNSLPLVSQSKPSTTWKFFRSKNPLPLVSGVSFPLTIQGWIDGNKTTNFDYQRVVELYQ